MKCDTSESYMENVQTVTSTVWLMAMPLSKKLKCLLIFDSAFLIIGE